MAVAMRQRKPTSDTNLERQISSGGTSLLSGVTCRQHEAGVGACVVDISGHQHTYDSIRLSELALLHWPDHEYHESLFRKLRFLYDTSKRDFLLTCEKDMMFIRSDFCRAVVEPERVLFLGIDNSTFQSFLEELTIEMQDADHLKGRVFNLWIAECIVCANVTMHTLRLQVMKPVATSILDNIRLDRCEDSILQLYPVKIALSAFIEQLRPLVHCLLHGVEDERDARERREQRSGGSFEYTGRQSSKPTGSRSITPGHAMIHSASGSHENLHSSPKLGMQPSSHSNDLRAGEEFEGQRLRSTSVSSSFMGAAELGDGYSLEKVLDDWTHNAEELMADATELSTNMDDAIRFLEASMSCMRNRLLQLELGAEVATLAFALGALVSGIFGMNLTSGIEETPGYFVLVIVFIAVCGVLICSFSCFVVYRSKRHYHQHSARFGNNKFFRSFGDDAYILSLGCSVRDGALQGDALSRALKDLTEPELAPISAAGVDARPRRPLSNRPLLEGGGSSTDMRGSRLSGSGNFSGGNGLAGPGSPSRDLGRPLSNGSARGSSPVRAGSNPSARGPLLMDRH